MHALPGYSLKRHEVGVEVVGKRAESEWKLDGVSLAGKGLLLLLQLLDLHNGA